MTTLLATNPLQPLIDVFESVLKLFHNDLNVGWGLAIVMLTVIVRMLLLPLTLKQFKSMQSMARHQPEMKKLQAKYKGDKDRLNQEMMKFYKENKINPLASCLPLVAQIPVFISLFYMLRKDLRFDICPGINPPTRATPGPCLDGGNADFLFIPNLTTKAEGAVLVVLIVLYVGSQLASTIMSTVSVDRNQRLIMYGLPFLFVTFVLRFPAGLLLYWITTNLWTIVQQLIVRRRLGPLRPPPDPSEKADKAQGGGFLQSLGLPSLSSSASPPSSREPVAVGAAPKGRPTGPPPAPPRRKKKRSGRRR
ncbi:MAG: YidC/Oxa1 family membrane protein insertase [Solirubrobacteraceae bacterium]